MFWIVDLSDILLQVELLVYLINFIHIHLSPPFMNVVEILFRTSREIGKDVRSGIWVVIDFLAKYTIDPLTFVSVLSRSTNFLKYSFGPLIFLYS
jgi:hypothetical protein